MYIYYQGSDGSIRTLGDNELVHYNHNHDALGRFARSAGASIRRSFENDAANSVANRYYKINKRQKKIDKYNRKLNTELAQRRKQKAAKFQRKLDKASVKARRAHKKQLKGKNLSSRDVKRLNKENKYRAKVAKYSKRNDKWEYKISKIERRNNRDARKINKTIQRYGDVALKNVRASDKTATVKAYLEANPTRKQLKEKYNKKNLIGETDLQTEKRYNQLKKQVNHKKAKQALANWDKNLEKPGGIYSKDHILDVIDSGNLDARHDLETDLGEPLESYVKRNKYKR